MDFARDWIVLSAPVELDSDEAAEVCITGDGNIGRGAKGCMTDDGNLGGAEGSVEGDLCDIGKWDDLYDDMKNGTQFGKLVYAIRDANGDSKL